MATQIRSQKFIGDRLEHCLQKSLGCPQDVGRDLFSRTLSCRVRLTIRFVACVATREDALGFYFYIISVVTTALMALKLAGVNPVGPTTEAILSPASRARHRHHGKECKRLCDKFEYRSVSPGAHPRLRPLNPQVDVHLQADLLGLMRHVTNMCRQPCGYLRSIPLLLV